MATLNCLIIPIFFKISSFEFSRRKKRIQVWNNLGVSNDDNIYIFCMI